MSENSEHTTCKILDLADLNPVVSLEKIDKDSEVSFIPMSDVSESGRWITHQTRLLREVRAGYTSFQEHDVLFAKITPCMENGKGCHAVGLTNGVGFGSTEFHVLRAKPDADAGFVFHLAQSGALRLKAAAKMTGSAGQQRVPSSFFAEYEVFKPTPNEQTQIAAVLSCIDRAIEQTEALIAKQQRIKTGLMQDLLTKGIDERGNIRSEATHEFHDSPLGRIPKEWDIVACADMAELITKGESPGWQGFQYQSEGVLFVTSENVRDGFLDVSINPKFIPHGFHRKLKRSALKYGDILINLVGASVARSALYNLDVEANINQAVCLLRLKASVCNKWLAYSLTLQQNIARLLGEQVETARANLSLTDIRNFKVATPDSHEQMRIAEALETTRRQFEVEQTHLSKIQQMKTGLMQDLLTGKVSVESLLPESVAS